MQITPLTHQWVANHPLNLLHAQTNPSTHLQWQTSLANVGTPYHDGLFFFDITFPLDYPNRPLMAHYRSFGFRINPNLYANGKVFLSLINTWVGKKIEKWNPNESTVLQLLLSIQGLVLNEKPYFNEPGNVAWPGRFWEKKSAA
ncbi:hypothetical protein SLEP1_g17257 [Rubroshorea leprosula]|uniref:UBC core domain-containing protein n=1 Tax=Rubroshorea leprosula TaxID=152421 RepID=A0AAV5J2W2_9ROSI|nr:hypothetical protein SLEP1_g17257 [Rubroshorea leprosula]